MACQIEINPQDLADWVEIANTSRLASIDENGKFLPISFFRLGVNINSRFIAVQVTSQSAKNTWVAGGYIAQAYRFPSFDVTFDSQFLKLSNTNLIELKENSNYNFDLIYYPRNYFTDISVRVWRYVGEETSFLETILTEIQESIENEVILDLADVHQKLDTLSQQIAQLQTKLDECCNNLGNQPITAASVEQEQFFFVN